MANVVATTSFITEVKGEQRIIGHGQVLSASDPVAKKHPELFAPEEHKSGA
jgi:hypothetical protein